MNGSTNYGAQPLFVGLRQIFEENQYTIRDYDLDTRTIKDVLLEY
jgi:hypothetical protein